MMTNWQNEGFRDGAAGIPVRDLTSATQDCAKFGIPVDSHNYFTGWQQGARQYCMPDRNVGYADGSAGKPLDVIYDRQAICLQAGVKLQLNAYLVGRQQGLRLFCTYETGISIAREGKTLPENVCIGALGAKLQAGWMAGKREFCGRSKNAFILGKENKPYPDMCASEVSSMIFKSEYDRGLAVGQRQRDLQTRLNELNNQINDINYGAWKRKDVNEIKDAQDRLNTLEKEKHSVESELFTVQMMR
jgi:hypothetical protein